MGGIVRRRAAIGAALGLTAAALGLAASCGGDASASSEANIGPEGGRITLGAVTLDVPPGALEQRVAIRVTEVAGPPPGYTALSPQYRFEPEGLRFRKPATVTFQAAGDVAVGEIAWSTPSGTALAELDSTASASSLAASVDHFSSGCAVVSTRCGAAGQACCRGTGCKSGLSCAAGRCAGSAPDAGVTDSGSGDAGPSSLKVACSAHFVGSSGAPLGIEVLSVASDPSGNIVVLGNFYGTADFGGGPLVSAGDRDLFVAKLDKDCKHLWSKRFGDVAEQAYGSVGIDLAGNIYLAGGETGTIDFGTGPLTSAGDYDVVVAKLTPSGDGVWAKRFGGAGSQVGVALDVTPGGKLLLGVQVSPSSGTVDFGAGAVATTGGVLVALDEAGAPEWTVASAGTGATRPDGGNQAPNHHFGRPHRSGSSVFMGGRFDGTMSAGGAVLSNVPPSQGISSGLLARYSAGGAHQWSKRIPSRSAAVATDWAGALAVQVRPDEPTDYGTGVVKPGPGFLRMTEDGDVLFAKTLPPHPAYTWDPTPGVSLAQVLPMGDRLLIAGHAAGVVTLEPTFTVGSTPIDSGFLEPKGFLALYNAAGALLWAETLGGTGAHTPSALSRHPSGGALMGGHFKGDLQVGSAAYSAIPNQYDGFVARLSPE